MKTGDARNIVYVLGHARSGSTILNILLGDISGVFAAGEISNYDVSGWKSDEFCSCGKKACECEFWSAVRQSVEPCLNLDSDELQSVTKAVDNWRSILPSKKSKAVTKLSDKYNQFAIGLYKAIFDQAGCDWVVDASKSPMRMHSLLRNDELSYYVIHVVRDPRAVCYSLNKALKKDPKGGVQKDLNGRPYLTTIKELYLSAFLSHLIKNKLPSERYIRLKHEDLVESTESVLVGLGSFLKVDCSELISRLASDGVLAQSHNVAGNRLRMQKNIKIRYDSSWLTEAGAVKHVGATLLLAPLLLWFKYPIFRKKRCE